MFLIIYIFKKNNKELTIFYICFELFKYFIMFFNFFNSSVSFQFYINNTLQEYLDNFYTIYLDDILIYSELKMKYEIYIKHIFQKLQETNLQVDVIKYKFH